jgi:hypothetical protein
VISVCVLSGNCTISYIGYTRKYSENTTVFKPSFSGYKLNSIAFIGFTPDPAARITVIS